MEGKLKLRITSYPADIQLWAIKTHALRKVFLGVKGVYYEIDAPGQGGDAVNVRWLEGYEFQQYVPHDVDFRILLTFLDLYRTLLGFTMFKLYTEENLVYPPPMDTDLDESGETVGALKLVERKSANEEVAAASKVSKKEVKRAIKGIKTSAGEDVEMDEEDEASEAEEDFVERPTHGPNEDVATAPLTTYSSIVATQPSSSSHQNLLFAPYTFYLSRETSSKTWEFVARAMGGKVISSLTAPSPDSTPLADTITHVIIDRPMSADRMREMQGGRKWVWVQPQWMADCVNRGKVLSAEEYGPGKMLPPHLSPWEGDGEPSRPWLEENGAAATVVAAESDEEEVEQDDEDEEDSDEEDEEEVEEEQESARPALLAAAQNPSDPTLVHAAELEAERQGVAHSAFTTQLKAATKAQNKSAKSNKKSGKEDKEEDLRKIMMPNKKAKLYAKMTHSNREKAAEVSCYTPTNDVRIVADLCRKKNSRRSEKPSRNGNKKSSRGDKSTISRSLHLDSFASVPFLASDTSVPYLVYAYLLDLYAVLRSRDWHRGHEWRVRLRLDAFLYLVAN